jgi:RNA polymerase sigma-B factor
MALAAKTLAPPRRPTETERGREAARNALNGSAAGRRLSTEVALGDEVELLQVYAATRAPALREELVRRLTPLARSLALRYRGPTEQIDDLMQVALLGLLKAIDGFDPERGKSFAADAPPPNRGELRRPIPAGGGTLRLPRALQDRTMAVQEAARELSEELGRSPIPAQIAERLEISEEDVWEALQANDARRIRSLDAPNARDDPEAAALVETLGHTEPGYEAVETQLAAEEAKLDERERRVLEMYFNEGLSQYQIGDRIGVSQMQISRITRRALRKLLDAVQGEA